MKYSSSSWIFLASALLSFSAQGSSCCSSAGYSPSDAPGMDSTSPSSASSQIIYGKLDAKLLSHKQLKAKTAGTGKTDFLMADLKYEYGKFKNSSNGDIIGGMAALSTTVSGVIELGAYIPYDYMDFKQFTAHRTGTVLYAKYDKQLPNSLQLTTLANFNYIATISRQAFATNDTLVNTFGGGGGLALSYDNGGDFVPKVSFAFQYNQDDYESGIQINDDHQYLIKTGVSVGYRLLENATLQTGFVYNRDITDYQNQNNRDKDYIDFTVGGVYSVADTWQINLTYKRIFGLESYYSNAVFLGTSFGF